MNNPLENLRERTREKLLENFSAFARRAWREIEPKPLQWSWHHELICEYLQLAYEREELRLIFCMPPRELKSRLVSVFFPAWVWAKDPGQSFILTSYSDSLSEELSVVRRNLLQSRWFQTTFPHQVRFSTDQNRREQYSNQRGGQMVATSTEGTLTGKGADYLIVDDLLSPQQSYSDLERENANRFFDSTLRSRLNEPMRGCIIVICQRLHEKDLPGHLLENEPGAWTLVNLPMEAEMDETITFPISGRVMDRKAGDLLHPARFPKTLVEKHKRTVGTFIWACQFQQRPAPAGGAIFKTSWFREYLELPKKGQSILALDTAFSTKRTADYSAAAVWVASEGKYFLAWVWRARVEYPQLKAVAEELSQFWRPASVLVEEKGSGQSLLQSLRQETALPVVGYQVEADKVSRAHAITALFESGRVFFPRSAPWLSDYLHELELFPNAAHDDMVDTTTMSLAYLRGQQYDGGLGVVDVLKKFDRLGIVDWLYPGKPVTRPPIPTDPAKPVQAVAVGGRGQRPHPEPCPLCAGPRVWHSGGRPGILVAHCNQCSSNDGQAPQVAIPAGDSCCGAPLQWVAGMRRCQNCGRQYFPGAPPSINGVSRGDYAAGVARTRARF